MFLTTVIKLFLIADFSASLHLDLQRVDPIPLTSFNNSKKKLLKCYDEVPELTPEIVMDILDSFDMSYYRGDRLKYMSNSMNISMADAKASYASMTQRCELEFVQPPGCKAGNAVALMLSGQTRSFLNPEVVKYWKKVSDAVRETNWKFSVFAVLDEVSFSKIVADTTIVKHNDSIQVLADTLMSFDPDAQYVFIHGETTMEAHRQYVIDNRLYKILTPQNEADAKNIGEGFECSYMKLVVGLDLILQYESQHNICYSHVFRARPDYLFLNWQSPAFLSNVWKQLSDSAYMINDAAAMMPRSVAGAYFTSFLMHRALKNLTQKASADLLDKFIRNDRPGSLAQPSTWVAYNGLIISGHGLEIDTYKGIAFAGEIEYPGMEGYDTHGFVVREDAVKGECLGNESKLVKHNITLPLCDAR